MKKISLLLGALFFSFMIGCKNIDELDVKPKDGLVKSAKPFVLDTNSVNLKPNSIETLKQLEAMFQKNMKSNKLAKKADFDNYAFGKAMWEANLSSEQNDWFDNIAIFGNNSEQVKEMIWNDTYEVEKFMSLIGMELNRNIFNQNAEIASPYFSLKLALLSAAHHNSIGDNLTGGWVRESYRYRYDNQTLDQIVFNDYIGRSVAGNTQNNGFYLFLDVVISSWIYGNRAVPGVTRVGTFNGVPLYANPFASGSFTLPASTRDACGIYLQSASLDDGDEIKHEFGHILQGEDLGLWCFYTEIAINSTKSANKNGQ